MRAYQLSVRSLFGVVLAIGLIQVAGYYLAGATVRSDGAFAIAQPDTLLYCQAARRIVEGCPFSFTEGTAVSTGTTSVLYPFVLAIPYALGATGDSLFLAGFVLNAIFYLIFLLGWTGVISYLFKGKDSISLVATVLLATFGPFAFCSMAQSDTGLWMSASAWIAYGLTVNRRLIYAPLLFIAPWIRPEGMILVTSYGFCLFVHCLGVKRLKKEILFFFLFFFSGVGVFVLNYYLTGSFQFSSVSQKGYFKLYSFAQAVYATAMDGIGLVKDILLGSVQKTPRLFFFIPVVGAVLIWLGAMTRQWRCQFSWRQGCWYLAVLGGLFTVATSGWQDINLDRYVMWGIPSVLLLMAEGAVYAEKALPQNGLSVVAVLLPCGYSVVASFVFMNAFHTCSQTSDRNRAFIRSCTMALPENASVGVTGLCGIAYELGGRRVGHTAGIYSPEFMFRDSVSKFELLKSEPSLRFDYWFVSNDEVRRNYGEKSMIFDGEIEAMGPDGFDLRKARWDIYDVGGREPDCGVAEVRLKAKVDVGFEPSEKNAAYELLTTYDQPDFNPVILVEKLNGVWALDGGRMIPGGEEMTVNLTPGRDAYVVMRTASRISTSYARTSTASGMDFAFKSPINLQLLLDDNLVETLSLEIGSTGFTDVRFRIPGRLITQELSRVCLLGEHISCGYWFYQ